MGGVDVVEQRKREREREIEECPEINFGIFTSHAIHDSDAHNRRWLGGPDYFLFGFTRHLESDFQCLTPCNAR